MKLNFHKKLIKLKTLIKTWSRRILTPIGRITLIKSLLLSQFNHLFTSLPTPNEQFLQELNTIFFNFLWTSKVDKVKRDITTQNYSEGGLKMVNVKLFIDSLKLSWVRRLLKKTCKWQIIFNSHTDLQKLSICGSEYIDECHVKCNNKFWKDVFRAWKKLNDSDSGREKIERQTCALALPLWYNRSITIGGKPVFYKSWYNRGVTIINDLVKESGTVTFYTFQEFLEKYHINVNFLQYQGLVSAVKAHLRRLNVGNQLLIYPTIPNNILLFMRNDEGTKNLYNIMIKNDLISTGRRKWEELFEGFEFDWTNIYCNPFRATKNTKLQWFQYRIVQNILTTNSFLFKVGLVNNPICNLCNLERETIIHILWECRETQRFLQSVETLLDALYIPFHYNKQIYLFGLFLNNRCSTINRLDNEILIIIKFYIYKTRCLHKVLSIPGICFN